MEEPARAATSAMVVDSKPTSAKICAAAATKASRTRGFKT